MTGQQVYLGVPGQQLFYPPQGSAMPMQYMDPQQGMYMDPAMVHPAAYTLPTCHYPKPSSSQPRRICRLFFGGLRVLGFRIGVFGQAPSAQPMQYMDSQQGMHMDPAMVNSQPP